MAMNSGVRPDEFFDDLEIMLPEKRERYLNQRLSETVEHAYRHTPIVRTIFDKAGVTPSQIRTTKDL